MMKILFKIAITALLIVTQTSYAQIKLEHTFNQSVRVNSRIANGEYTDLTEDRSTYPDNSYSFTETNEENSSFSITIYNSDFSLNTNKTYNFTPPSGYKLYWVNVSRKFYNSDDNYEFIVTWQKKDYTSYDNTMSKVLVYTESGNILKDFGSGASISVSSYLHITNNQYRLFVHRHTYDENNDQKTQTEVYSIEGSGLSSIPENDATLRAQSPYPNPSNTVINLPYTLRQGEFGVMNILNMQGQLIEKKQIGFAFDKVALNVSDYKKGVYFYEVNSVSHKFIVE